MFLNYIPCWLLLVLSFVSCQPGSNKVMEKQQQLEAQLKILNTLLRDSVFTLSVAKAQDSAYYTSQGKEIPDFTEGVGAAVKKMRKKKRLPLTSLAFMQWNVA